MFSLPRGIIAICLIGICLLQQANFSEATNLRPPKMVNEFVIEMVDNVFASAEHKLGDTNGGLMLEDARKMQEWLMQVIAPVVVPDPVYEGIYNCKSHAQTGLGALSEYLGMQKNGNVQHTNGMHALHKLEKHMQNHPGAEAQVLRLLYSLGARLSATIGRESSDENGAEEQNKPLRAFLKAFECMSNKHNSAGGIYENKIEPVMESMENGEWKITGLIFEKQNGEQAEYIGNFAFLRKLNELEMSAEEAFKLVEYIHYVYLKEYTDTKKYSAMEWIYGHGVPENPFHEGHLAKLGLKVETLGQDPDLARRVVNQLVIHLKGWTHGDVVKMSKKEATDPIQMGARELCTLRQIGRNLLKRIQNYELLQEEYLQVVNLGRGIRSLGSELEFFEEFDQNHSICREMMGDKNQLEEFKRNENYLAYDEAIRIEFNVWKEIMRNVEVISELIKEKHKKKELDPIMESSEYKEAMKRIRAKINLEDAGLELKLEESKYTKNPIKKYQIHQRNREKVEKFRENLEIARQNCEQKIEEYEVELPTKKSRKAIVARQKEIYDEIFWEKVIKAIVEKFGGKENPKNKQQLRFGLENSKEFLEKLYGLTKIEKIHKNSEKWEPKFAGLIKELVGKDVEIETNGGQWEKYLKTVEGHTVIDKQLIGLLYSFGARLEALVNGKPQNRGENSENEENSEKIKAFLAATNDVALPEWANNYSVMPYFMDIILVDEEDENAGGIIGVAIHKKVREYENATLQIIKQSYELFDVLNTHQFSIYETLILLRKIYDKAGPHSTTYGVKISEITEKFVEQIEKEYGVKYYGNREFRMNSSGRITHCEYVKLYQKIRAKFVEQSEKRGVQIENFMGNLDKTISDEEIQKEYEDNCGKLIKEIGKNRKDMVSLLENNLRYDLMVNFSFDPWKDLHDRVDDLIFGWQKHSKSKDGADKLFVPEISDYRFVKILEEYQSDHPVYQITKVGELAPEFELPAIYFQMKKQIETVNDLSKKLNDAERSVENTKDNPVIMSNAKYDIEKHQEYLKETSKNIDAKEKEIGETRIRIKKLRGDLEKTVPKLREEAKKLAEWAKNGEKSEKPDKIEEKICEMKQIGRKLESVKGKTKLLIRNLEVELGPHQEPMLKKFGGIMHQAPEQKAKNEEEKVKIVPLTGLKKLEHKINELEKKISDFEGKIVGIFQNCSADNPFEKAVQNCGPSESVDQKNSEKEVEKLEKQFEQLKHELEPEMGVMGMICELENSEQSLDVATKNLEELKGNFEKKGQEKPQKFKEIVAESEAELAKATKDHAEGMAKLREVAKKYQDKLEHMLEEFGKKTGMMVKTEEKK